MLHQAHLKLPYTANLPHTEKGSFDCMVRALRAIHSAQDDS